MLFFKTNLGDFHCGLRGFVRARIQAIQLQTKGMEFASEMIVKAILNNLTIAEVPVTLFPDGRTRKPHLRPWRDGFRHLYLLLVLSPRWLFFYPGILLLLVGMLGIVLGSLTIGAGIYGWLSVSLFITMSLQLIVLFLFTQIRRGPSKESPQRLFKQVLINKDGVIGFIFALFGLIDTSLFAWMHHLIKSDFLKATPVLIPAATAIMVSFQMIAFNLYLKFLSLMKT